jgi:hypothetical protein
VPEILPYNRQNFGVKNENATIGAPASGSHEGQSGVDPLSGHSKK